MADLEKKDVCVLIPAYNEGKNIGRVARQVMDLGFPLLVIDDGSRDNTLEALKELNVEVLASPANRGKGASMSRGFEWFLGKPYEALILMDADGQHETKELNLFLTALNRTGWDLIIGNRMNHPENMPFIRRATNRLLSRILSAITRQGIPDSQCGYRAARRRLIEKISLRTLRFEIESEMLLEAARLGFSIGSVPIRCLYAGETSQIHPLRDTLRFFRFLFSYIFSEKSL